MGTLVVSDDAADIMVLDRAKPLRRLARVRRTVQATNRVWPAVFAVVVFGSLVVHPAAALVLIVGLLVILFTVSSSADASDLLLALTEGDETDEPDEQITAVHLWRALCENIDGLVAATNFVPALVNNS